MDKYFDHIVHGGDYNPDQWMSTKEIWDEDMRLMKLAHVNSASIGIFSWARLEPEEGVYDFSWLDEIMDKCAANGIDVILATPSGARPAWLAKKYPEVLRVNPDGVRNEFGIRHNHCLTSEVYREKTAKINRLLAERYKDHPALKMWHISNEYSGECYCDKCRAAFREWLKKYYKNDLADLNERWWTGFWSHTITDWEQIDPPSDRGEPLVSALKLCWRRFVSDSHISFFDNEIAPLKEVTPDVPVTTNFMRMYSGIDYQAFASHVDIISWDNYPEWTSHPADEVALDNAFVHDVFRSMKDGKPFFMMESTPSVVNWKSINKIPAPGTTALTSMQAVAHGSDSVQYFQWRKGRGGHEKYHGAVVDHCGHEDTRVFREIEMLGKDLEKLDRVTGTRITSRVAVICDWQTEWGTRFYCGYNNNERGYFGECRKWHNAFRKKGISVDVISLDADFSKYDIIAAPYLYLLKDGSDKKIEEYVRNGGSFLMTYLSAAADSDDRAFLGGLPANGLKEVFGIWAEETDSIPPEYPNRATFGCRSYKVDHICDIIHADTATILGTYENDFYAGMPSVTRNNFGKGKAYYAAFRNDGELADDICEMLLYEADVRPGFDFKYPDGVFIQERGNFIFVMNFGDKKAEIIADNDYYDLISGKKLPRVFTLPAKDYAVLER